MESVVVGIPGAISRTGPLTDNVRGGLYECIGSVALSYIIGAYRRRAHLSLGTCRNVAYLPIRLCGPCCLDTAMKVPRTTDTDGAYKTPEKIQK